MSLIFNPTDQTFHLSCNYIFKKHLLKNLQKQPDIKILTKAQKNKGNLFMYKHRYEKILCVVHCMKPNDTPTISAHFTLTSLHFLLSLFLGYKFNYSI